MVFSKNNVKMFKWNQEKQANGFTAKFFFTITLTVFDVHFRWGFSEKREQEREKHHHLATDHSSQPIRVPKLSQLLKKKHKLGGRKTNYTGNFQLALTKTQKNPENLKEVKRKSKQKR